MDDWPDNVILVQCGRVDEIAIAPHLAQCTTAEPCFDCGTKVWVNESTKKVMREQKEEHDREHRFLCNQCAIIRYAKIAEEEESLRILPNHAFGAHRNN